MAVSDDAERRLGDRGRERRWGVSVDERCEGVVVSRVRAQRLYRAEVCAWRHWIGYGTDAGLRRMAAWTSRVCKTHTRSVASRPFGQPSDPSHEGLPERAIPRALLHSSSLGRDWRSDDSGWRCLVRSCVLSMELLAHSASPPTGPVGSTSTANSPIGITLGPGLHTSPR